MCAATATLSDPTKRPIVQPPLDPNEWSPPAELVSASPLRGYTRYYFGSVKDGRKIVAGTMVASRFATNELGETAPGHFHILRESAFPMVMGGGCNFINLWFDIKADKLSIHCNAPK